MTIDKETQDFLNIEVAIYPNSWLTQQYENGVPIEEIKKAIAEKFKSKKGLIAGASAIAERFYKKWDGEGDK